MKPPYLINPFLPGVEIQITPKEERIPEHWVADEGWRFVDGHGHGHFYDATTETHYPTLRREHRACDVHDDCEGEVYWWCKLCGEVITPGTRLVPERVEALAHEVTIIWNAPGGNFTYKLNDEEYGEVMSAVTAAASAAFERVMAKHVPVSVELRTWHVTR